MPNGGVTPDCVHCKLYKGQPHTEDEPFCTHHEIKLAYPIRAFCKGFIDLEGVDDVDWLDQELDRGELDENLMYVWLGGHEVAFFHVPLALISEYTSWTREEFLEELATLSDKYQRD